MSNRTCGCATPSHEKRDDVQDVGLGRTRRAFGYATEEGCDEWTRRPEGRPRQ